MAASSSVFHYILIPKMGCWLYRTGIHIQSLFDQSPLITIEKPHPVLFRQLAFRERSKNLSSLWIVQQEINLLSKWWMPLQPQPRWDLSVFSEPFPFPLLGSASSLPSGWAPAGLKWPISLTLCHKGWQAGVVTDTQHHHGHGAIGQSECSPSIKGTDFCAKLCEKQKICD